PLRRDEARSDHGFPRGQNPGNRTRSSPDRVVNTQRCRAIVVLLPQSAGRSLAFLPSFARLASFHLFIKGAFFSISSNSSLASSGVRTTLGRRKTNSSTSRVDLSFFLKAHPSPGMLPIIGVFRNVSDTCFWMIPPRTSVCPFLALRSVRKLRVSNRAPPNTVCPATTVEDSAWIFSSTSPNVLMCGVTSRTTPTSLYLILVFCPPSCET